MLHLAERLGNCTANPIGCLPGDITEGRGRKGPKMARMGVAKVKPFTKFIQMVPQQVYDVTILNLIVAGWVVI
jgi:hypothetical protein